MTIIRLTKILALAVLLQGCSQLATKTEYDRNIDFSKLKTYRWGESALKIDKTGQSVDRTMDEIAIMVRDNIQPLVNKHMSEKGFQLIKEGKPDFVVQYSAKSKAHDVYSKETYAPGGVSPATPVERSGMMNIGTLTIYVLEPGSFKVLWRGEVETIIRGDDKTNMRFKKAIDKILKDFPPS